MKTISTENTRNTVAHDDLNQAGKVGLIAVTTLGGLIGAWGIACMVGAFATSGIGGVISGFLSAITGM